MLASSQGMLALALAGLEIPVPFWPKQEHEIIPSSGLDPGVQLERNFCRQPGTSK